MKSKLFYTGAYKGIEGKIKGFINKYPEFLSENTAGSTRAIGDAIQNILENNFEDIIGGFSKQYSAQFARRAMADLAFMGKDNFYYVVDVKTHRMDTKFNMPNLTSVERLSRFYEDDKNYYVVSMVAYELISETRIRVEEVYFIPIEFLSWDCLTIGALGWGQVQIANASKMVIKPEYSRKKWMLELCNFLFEFYPHEIEKIKGRIKYFKKVKQKWEQKADIWA